MTDFQPPETMYVDPEHPHLGGYHRGGDPLSWYPEMWEWLIESEGISSVIDVGCGEGRALDFFAARICVGLEDDRCPLVGIDGVEQTSPHVFQHDYTTGPAPMYDFTALHRFDLVWCCEFVEHVDERFVPNFLDTFEYGELVLMTHALPGQGGHHHVNCRIDEYWLGVMAAIGYAHDRVLTMRTRELAGGGYYAWSGLAFRRT